MNYKIEPNTNLKICKGLFSKLEYKEIKSFEAKIKLKGNLIKCKDLISKYGKVWTCYPVMYNGYEGLLLKDNHGVFSYIAHIFRDGTIEDIYSINNKEPLYCNGEIKRLSMILCKTK